VTRMHALVYALAEVSKSKGILYVYWFWLQGIPSDESRHVQATRAIISLLLAYNEVAVSAESKGVRPGHFLIH